MLDARGEMPATNHQPPTPNHSLTRMIDFTLPTDSNELLSLSSLRGKNVILYFYPVSTT